MPSSVCQPLSLPWSKIWALVWGWDHTVTHLLGEEVSEHGSSVNYVLIISSKFKSFSSVQFIPVAQSCPTLCDPMNRRAPGHPMHHQLPESTQTHVHRVDDAIQPFHPLLSPSPPAFTSGGQSIGASASVSALSMHVQH